MLQFVKKYSFYLKNSSIYLFATIISSVLGVAINPLLALNLSAADYAIVGYYSGYTTLFTPLIGFFLVDYYLRHRYSLCKEKLCILKSTIIRLFLYFSGGVSVFCLFGLYAYIKIDNVSIPFFPYAVLTILQAYLGMLYAFKTAEYKIDGNSKSFFKYSVVNALLNAAIALLFVVVLRGGALGKLSGAFFVSLIFFLYILHSYRDDLKTPANYKIVTPIIKYSTPLVLAGMLGFFSGGYDRVLLEKNGDIYTLGIYSVAVQMSGYLNIFATAIKSTFQPDIYKAIAEKNKAKLTKEVLLIIGSVSFVVLVFIICCPFIIHILTAGRYDESTRLTQILSLSVITSTIYYQVSQVTYGSGLSNITLINKIIGSILSLGLFSFMIPAFGVSGAAWSVVLCFMIYAAGNLILLYIFRNKFLVHNEKD